MTEDVVPELDRWADDIRRLSGPSVDADMLQRARDEIVALRQLTDGNWVWQQITSTRDEALEEAARVCEGGYTTGSTHSTLKAIAAAIRALKEKADHS